MRHLLIQQRSQRLFLLFILLASLYFLTRSNLIHRGQDFHFERLPGYIGELERNFLPRDRVALKEMPFTGYINPLKNKIYIKSKLDNLNLNGNKVSADILFVAKGISCWASIKNLKIDESRLLNILSKFEYAKDKLRIVFLKFGDSYFLKGTVGLNSPNSVDLNLKIVRANIRDLATIARVKDADAIFGIMEGEFFIKGTFRDLVSKGSLAGRNGRIGLVHYDSANINFEGFGPILRIVDSRVRQGQGSMALEGLIDLRNIGKENLYNSIRVSADESAYSWNGWGITKNGSSELGLERDVSEEFKVSFKTSVQEEPLPDYGTKDEVRLEYKMGNESIKMKLKEDEEFFGVEKSLRF